MPRNPTPQNEPKATKRQRENLDIASSTVQGETSLNGFDFGTWLRPVVHTVRFVSIVLCILFAFAFTCSAIARRFDGLVHPNVYVGQYNLGGYSYAGAVTFLQNRFNEIQTQGYPVSAADKTVRVHGSVSAVSDPDLSYEFYALDVDASVAELYASGRSGSLVSRGIHIIANVLYPERHDLKIRFNGDQIHKVLQENFSSLERPGKHPRVIVSRSSSDNTPRFEIVDRDPMPGATFDYSRAVEQLRARIISLSDDPISLVSIPDVSTISKRTFEAELPGITQRLQTMFSGSELTFATSTATNTTIVTLPHERLAEMISFEELKEPVAGADHRVVFGLNDKLDGFFETLSTVFGREARDAKFVLANGKVTEFQSEQHGLRVLKGPVEDQIITILNQDTFVSRTIIVSMETVVPMVQTSDVNNLGIRELIGVGKSKFSGSPSNRRHNIKVGATAVNGTLIPPGEEFSLLKTLGDISSKSGYLPELVIKGDRTIPEYGGGLCQIGTTTFRGALDSGLPITARTNHSYRVTYYEPAGTDATIYDPNPDFRFMNDTGHHILIQTRIEGDEATFEFWGTRDGRMVTQTKPKIYNIVAPPETKYVETTDLKPGEEKCTERAHAGADAEFTYSVAYPTGEIQERIFKSHYRPWQAVCLKGVVALSTSTPPTL